MQTKKWSLIESISNIAIGYFVALASQLIIFPVFGMRVSIGDNILIGIWFTIISIVRSYTVRRLFNRINK